MRKFMASVFSALFGGDGDRKETETAVRPRFRRAASPPADPPPPPHDGSGDGHSPELSARLRRIFDRRDPTQAGSIHLLGLESLHEKLGSRWIGVADRVHQLTAKLLNQHLSDQDVWFRHGEEAYVVVFAHLAQDQARLVCAKVVEELQIMLLGHADTDSILVHSAVHEMGAELVLAPVSLKQMLDGVRADGQGGMAASAASGGGSAQTGFRAATVARAGPPHVRYRPVWDVDKQLLSLYGARCCRLRPGRTPLWGYDCLDDPEDAASIMELDLLVAREALETALELYDNRFRFILSLPLHFESLAVIARRQAVMGMLRSVPRYLLPFVAYHLHGVPAGVPAGRLSELVSALKPFGRTVMLELASANADMAAAAAAGIRVVNLTLPHDASVERWRPEVGRFCTTAQRHRLLPAVEGVGTLAMEDMCEEAGVRFLSGDLIGGWVDVPEHVVRRSRTDFVRQRPDLRANSSE